MWTAPWWELVAAVAVMVGLGAAGLGAEKSSAMRGLLVAAPTPRLVWPERVSEPDQKGRQYQEVSGSFQ